VKYYESMRVVYEIQTRLKEWAEEQPAQPAPQTNTPPQQAPAGGETK